MADVELTLDIAGVIEGVVVDRDGRPIPGIKVAVKGDAPHDPGPHDPGPRRAVGALATVRVRVRTADGAPVAGAVCGAAQPPAPTDREPVPAGADGVVTLAVVAPGEVALHCGHRTDSTSAAQLLGQATVTVAPGATTDVDVTLAPSPPADLCSLAGDRWRTARWRFRGSVMSSVGL